MVVQSPKVTVIVTHGETKAEFSGSPESVLASVNNFLSKQIPAINLANRIHVSYSVPDLIDLFEEYVKITPEGPTIWKAGKKLSDKFIIGLQLVATKIAHESGRPSPSSLTLAELESQTGLNPKSLSSRLSEMVKLGYVNRDSSETGVRHHITTQGVYWLSETLTNISSKK